MRCAILEPRVWPIAIFVVACLHTSDSEGKILASFSLPKNSVLAKALADTIVTAMDPVAQECGIFYSRMAEPWVRPIINNIRKINEAGPRQLGLALSENPTDVNLYHSFQDAVTHAADQQDVFSLLTAAWNVEEKSRIGFYVGDRYERKEQPVTLKDLSQTFPKITSPENYNILVIVPFQARGERSVQRLRNLIACLYSLQDQSYPKRLYKVVVVESDDWPRWQQTIEPFSDGYIFAKNRGTFNKSWAVNVGVTNTTGQPGVICMLDADVLVDRDFISRNANRLMQPGRGGHFPHRDMSCMDSSATSWAIRQRVFEKKSEPPESGLRAFLLRKSPGCCIWVRREAFLRISGFDERYEGWGGEDYDFFMRLDMATPIDHFDDRLLHMYHPPSSHLNDDGSLATSDIPPLSWKPGQVIGQINKFAD